MIGMNSSQMNCSELASEPYWVSKLTMSSWVNCHRALGWTGMSSYKNRTESWTELPSSFNVNWTESLQELSDKHPARLFIGYHNATQSLPGCIIEERSGYGAATLDCRPCVAATRYAYRNHMHFYCFQLGFKCSLPKKRYEIRIDKRPDEVLPGSATSGIYHDFLSASNNWQQDRSRHTSPNRNKWLYYYCRINLP